MKKTSVLTGVQEKAKMAICKHKETYTEWDFEKCEAIRVCKRCTHKIDNHGKRKGKV